MYFILKFDYDAMISSSEKGELEIRNLLNIANSKVTQSMNQSLLEIVCSINSERKTGFIRF